VEPHSGAASGGAFTGPIDDIPAAGFQNGAEWEAMRDYEAGLLAMFRALLVWCCPLRLLRLLLSNRFFQAAIFQSIIPACSF